MKSFLEIALGEARCYSLERKGVLNLDFGGAVFAFAEYGASDSGSFLGQCRMQFAELFLDMARASSHPFDGGVEHSLH